MSTRRTAGTLIHILLSMSLVVATTAALAADAPPAPAAPSKEMREKMASLHEKIAACLRSTKSFDECREEMRSGCQQMMGGQGCQMMEMHRGRPTP